MFLAVIFSCLKWRTHAEGIDFTSKKYIYFSHDMRWDEMMIMICMKFHNQNFPESALLDRGIVILLKLFRNPFESFSSFDVMPRQPGHFPSHGSLRRFNRFFRSFNAGPNFIPRILIRCSSVNIMSPSPSILCSRKFCKMIRREKNTKFSFGFLNENWKRKESSVANCAPRKNEWCPHTRAFKALPTHELSINFLFFIIFFSLSPSLFPFISHRKLANGEKKNEIKNATERRKEREERKKCVVARRSLTLFAFLTYEWLFYRI